MVSPRQTGSRPRVVRTNTYPSRDALGDPDFPIRGPLAHVSQPSSTPVTKMLKKFPELEVVFYDITNKPPATVEWL